MSNKQTTAMQELIDYLNANQLLKLNQVTAKQLDDKCSELLTKEREIIINAAKYVPDARTIESNNESAQTYFTQNFKQD